MRPKGHAQQATHLPQAHPLTKQTWPCPCPLQIFTPRSDCKECSVTILLPASTTCTCRNCDAPQEAQRAPLPRALFLVQHSSATPMSPLGSLRSLCPMFGSAVRGSMPLPLSLPRACPAKPFSKPSHTIQHTRLPAKVVFRLAGRLTPMPHALQKEHQQAPLRPALHPGSSTQRTLTLGSSTAGPATAAAPQQGRRCARRERSRCQTSWQRPP